MRFNSAWKGKGRDGWASPAWGEACQDHRGSVHYGKIPRDSDSPKVNIAPHCPLTVSDIDESLKW